MSYRKCLILFLLFFVLVCRTHAQSSYNLLYEKKFSSKTGAEDILTIHKAFYLFEEKYLPPRLMEEKKESSKIFNAGYRFAKSFIIDYPVDFISGLAQHEAFGHGARFREFNYTNNSYELNLPPPYGIGHGFAKGTPPVNTTFDEAMTVTVSGNESNTLLCDLLRSKWIMDDSIHYRDFFLYIGGYHNTSYYIFENKMKPYGDIDAYLSDIRIKYYDKTGNKYTIDDLVKYSLINVFDPYQFIAFYHWCNYILTGKQKGKMWMTTIGNVKYLPSFELALTPFGSEFYMNNYVKWRNRTFKVYGRYGEPTFEKFWGAGASVYNILKTNTFFINSTADLWEQPSLRLQDNDTHYRNTVKGYGACASATLGINFFRNRLPWNLIVQGGYKTDGYLMGENLAKGPFLRVGIGFVNL